MDSLHTNGDQTLGVHYTGILFSSTSCWKLQTDEIYRLCQDLNVK